MIDVSSMMLFRTTKRNVCYLDDRYFLKKSLNNNIADEYYYVSLFENGDGISYLNIPSEIGKGYIIYPYLKGYSHLDLNNIDYFVWNKILNFLNIQNNILIDNKCAEEIIVKHTQNQLLEFKKNIDRFVHMYALDNTIINCLYGVLEDIQKARHLAHGDFGHSNIMIKDDKKKIKIIDYEYFMYAPKCFDYARLLSSLISHNTYKELILKLGINNDVIIYDGYDISNYLLFHLVNQGAYKDKYDEIIFKVCERVAGNGIFN